MRIDKVTQQPFREYQCPVHDKPLLRKRVVYGLMPASDVKHSPANVILGGCLYDESRKYGYECAVDQKVYFLEENGILVPQHEDDPVDE